ncbi:hypothetical protein DPSP01_007248 [Paraphaeosphaeria sporulosa]|uniref:Uncharacterized protein n=1 Tax=Paraphaeosphaeria sporulosa TaxID=1460663 RepID=A0A177C4D7_9PLEO|nr:uncharacterized protein CC84DRAFT_1262246 [Paraphaeosphaeria sporulosa]OAG02276.1 hypothetical protein CC84DRAFT_1262246 [Paraphaeosphaeria sporulosa]
MTSTHEKIRQAASRNAELLAGLHETDSAPSQLYQQIQYIKDLNEQLKATEKQVSRLKEKTALELKDHRKYNESTFRRFAHRASGRTDKFNEKAAKEEKEYFDAIQAQKSAEDELGYVRQLVAEAEVAKAGYEKDAARHDEYQRALDALYNSIFAGTTPEFPEEDAREAACEAANARLQSLAQTLEKERHVLELVKKACGRLLDAKRLLMQAHDMSTMDLWGGSTFASMAKRNALEQADSCMRQVRMLSQQISQIEPGREVRSLGAVDVRIGNIWSDVVFDNIFTDMEMHQRIQAAEAQLDRALGKGAQLMKEQQGREKALLADVNYASGELRERRVELQWSREEAFRKVVGGEQPPPQRTMPQVEGEDEAPPAYSREA